MNFNNIYIAQQSHKVEYEPIFKDRATWQGYNHIILYSTGEKNIRKL